MKLQIVRQDTNELSEYIEAKKNAAEADARLQQAAKALIDKMTREERKTMSTRDGGKQYRVTYVQNMRTEIDEPGLKKAMGAVPFRKVCKQVVDRKLLEEALDEGTADKHVVAQFIKEVPSKPFLKYTEGQLSDESTSTADDAQ